MADDLAIELIGAGVKEDRVEKVLLFRLTGVLFDGLVDTDTHVAGIGVDQESGDFPAPGREAFFRGLDLKALQLPAPANVSRPQVGHRANSLVNMG